MSDIRIATKIKEDIEKAKVKKSQAEGRIQTLEERLNTDFKCNFEEAKNKIKELQKRSDNLSEKIETDLDTLRDNYEF
jgi:flagellar hook-basal body complex protein FliE